jgi:hypothetical protein
MFFQFSKLWVRPVQLKQFARRLVSAVRQHGAERAPDLDTLRHRLDEASRRVITDEQLVHGWRQVVESELAAGQDASLGQGLLRTFQLQLEEALSAEREAKGAHRQRLLDLFRGVTGHSPANDQELNAWLASPAGKAATAFEPTSHSTGSDRTRS